MNDSEFDALMRAAMTFDTAKECFAPGFADRVMSSINAAPSDDIPHALMRQSRRALPALLAALLALIAWNVKTTRSRAGSFVAAAFAITQSTVAATPSAIGGATLTNAEFFQ